MSLRRIVHGLALTGTVAMAIRGLLSAYRAETSLSRLGEANGHRRRNGPEIPIRIVIPVLLEQESIRESFEFFACLAAQGATEVVFVSTDVEERAVQAATETVEGLGSGVSRETIIGCLEGVLGPEIASDWLGDDCAVSPSEVLDRLRWHKTTGQMLCDLLEEFPASGVRHVHFDGESSSMALQVRAGAGLEWERGKPASENYVAVYNVDSRPEHSTLESAREQIDELRRVNGTLPNVLQQSSAFVGRDGSDQSSVSLAAGIAQTRWTLGTEIAKLRRQGRAVRKGSRIPALAICVGHGLFIRAEYYELRHELPTFVMQEDLAYGFLMSADREPVYPLRTLDRATTPSTLRALNSQKQQWFWAYLEYPKVSAHAAALGVPRSDRLALLAQALADAVLWLGTSPGLWAAIALPFVRRRYSLLSAVAVGSYVVWPQVRYPRALRRRGHEVRPLRPLDLLSAVLIVGTDSIGPYRAIAAMLFGSGEVVRRRTAKR